MLAKRVGIAIHSLQQGGTHSLPLEWDKLRSLPARYSDATIEVDMPMIPTKRQARYSRAPRRARAGPASIRVTIR